MDTFIENCKKLKWALIAKMLSFVGILFLFIMALNVCIFIAGYFELIPEVYILALILLVIPFSFFLYFYLRKRMFVLSSNSQITLSTQEIKERIRYFFKSDARFEVDDSDSTFRIIYEGSIAYNQLLDSAYRKIHFEACVSFDESKRIMDLVTKKYDLNVSFSRLSIAGHKGFSIGYSNEQALSIEMENGKPVLKIKSLEFSSMDITIPTIQIALDGGWNVRLGKLMH